MTIDTSHLPMKDAGPDPRNARSEGEGRRPPEESRGTQPVSELAPTDSLPAATVDYETSEEDLTIRLQPDSAPDPTIPVSIDRVIAGRYCLEREIGRGGFGIVLLAYDRELHRQVAIKVARRPEKRGVDLLLEEARKVAQLDHPHIVPVFDCGRIDRRTAYVVSKYVDGGNLSHQLALRRLEREEVVRIALQMARALAHAHERNLIHRDLKPSNILLDSSGNAYVADFGLALKAADRSDRVCVEGTPHYMSPEQANGKSRLVDRRTDVFSFGVILYELLTGVRPYPGLSADEYRIQVSKQDPAAPRRIDPAIPDRLEQICVKAMSRDPDERHTSAWELARELESWAATPRRVLCVRIALVALAIALLVALLAWAFARLLAPEPTVAPPTVALPSTTLGMQYAPRVISRGGAVDFDGVFPPTIESIDDLPAEPALLRSISLLGTGPVSQDDVRTIASLPGLIKLHLGITGLDDNQLAEICRLSQLQLLILCYNDLTDQGVDHLKSLPALVHLDLERTLVTDNGLDFLDSTRRLRFLNLSENKISDAGVRRLRHLDELEVLYLRNTDISDACVDDLLRLSRLRELAVQGTALSDEAIDRLEAGLPGCRILR